MVTSEEQKKSIPSPLPANEKDRYPSTCTLLHSPAERLKPFAPMDVTPWTAMFACPAHVDGAAVFAVDVAAFRAEDEAVAAYRGVGHAD